MNEGYENAASRYSFIGSHCCQGITAKERQVGDGIRKCLIIEVGDTELAKSVNVWRVRGIFIP